MAQDWTRPLPVPAIGRDGRELATLHDVRAYVLDLPPEQQHLRGWLNVADCILRAAEGESVPDIGARRSNSLGCFIGTNFNSSENKC